MLLFTSLFGNKYQAQPYDIPKHFDIKKLPPELFSKITQFLPLETIKSLRTVSKTFNEYVLLMSSQSRLWPIFAGVLAHTMVDGNSRSRELLEQHRYSPESLLSAFEEAVKFGHLELATLLIHDQCFTFLQKAFNFSIDRINRYNCIRDDCQKLENVYLKVLELLLKDPLVDPAALNNYAITAASVGGNTDIVKLLLKHPRVDPTAKGNYAIKYASKWGRVDVVELLLKDHRVDPAAKNNFAIQVASLNGHADVVELLLKHPLVDPTAGNYIFNDGGNTAIKEASRNGHANVVELFLKDPRVDPSAENNFAIRYASRKGHADVVELLLKHPRVDPGDRNNSSIKCASWKGHANVVVLLLKDPRVDPSAENNFAIRYASKKGHADVVELLLKDPRVALYHRQNRFQQCINM